MKKYISLLLSVVMVILSANTVCLAEADTDIVWTKSDEATVCLDEKYTIKGKAVCFRAWDVSDAFASAEQADVKGAFKAEFSMLFSDTGASRIVEASGVEVLNIDKNGVVRAGEKILKDKLSLNYWYDVNICIYPDEKIYSVAFGDVSTEMTFDSSASGEAQISFAVSDIDLTGTAEYIAGIQMKGIKVYSQDVTESPKSLFGQNNGNNTTDTGTRTYNTAYPDPTGSGRGNLFMCSITNTGTGKYSGGEWQSPPAQSVLDRTKVAVFSCDFFVDDSFKTHEFIAYGSAGGYYWLFKLDHQKKELNYGNNRFKIDLDYEPEGWFTARTYLNFEESWYIVNIYKEDGTFIGGVKYDENMAENSVLRSIGRFGLQFTFLDALRDWQAYLYGYGYSYITDPAVISRISVSDGEINTACDGDIRISVKCNDIDPESVSAAEFILNDNNVAADIRHNGPRGVVVKTVQPLDENTLYTMQIVGLRDILGNDIEMDGDTTGEHAPGPGQQRSKADSAARDSVPNTMSQAKTKRRIVQQDAQF